MSYTPFQWKPGVAGGTIVSAQRLNHMENGIGDVSESVDALELIVESLESGDRGTFNVLDYGAVGNGTTNDRGAIQAALDDAYAAGGGTVLFPGGKTYSVGSGLVVRANTRISAYGATLLRATPTFSFLRNFQKGVDSFPGYTGHGNIIIEGGIWDGNSTTATTSTSGNMITFAHAENVMARDLTVLNISAAHAVEFNGVKHGRAINCRAYGMTTVTTNSEAFQLDVAGTASGVLEPYDNTPCVDIVIDGCDCGPSALLGTWGRLTGGHTSYPGVFHSDIRITNNTTTSTIEHGIRIYQCNDVLIANNVLNNAGSIGIQARPGDPGSGGGGSDTCRGLVITGNIIRGTGGDGIQVLGLSATALMRDVTINGNVIYNTGGDGIQADWSPSFSASGNKLGNIGIIGIGTTSSDRSSISGNSINNTGTHGIAVNTCTGTTIVGNSIDTAGGYGVVMSPNAISGRVSDNSVTAASSGAFRASAGTNYTSFTNNTSRLGALAAFTGSAISITAGCTGVVRFGNDFFGHGSGGISDAGISTVTSTTDRV